MSEAVKINYLNETDAEALSHLMTTNADIFKRFFTNTLAQNTSVGSSQDYIAKKTEEIKSNVEFTFAIRNRSNTVIGLIILKDLKFDSGEGELAYCLDKNEQGRGIVTKGVNFVSDFAFNELKFKKLKIFTHKSNSASIKVAENTGFRWVQTLSKAYQPPDEAPLDMEIYELDYER